MKLLWSSATSILEIASLRSERTSCTKAITSDWLRTRPGKTPLPKVGAGYERLQSLRPGRARALRHLVPARRDFHRRHRRLPDAGSGGRPGFHDQADDRRHGLAGRYGKGDGRAGRRKVGEADAGAPLVRPNRDLYAPGPGVHHGGPARQHAARRGRRTVLSGAEETRRRGSSVAAWRDRSHGERRILRRDLWAVRVEGEGRASSAPCPRSGGVATTTASCARREEGEHHRRAGGEDLRRVLL